MTDQSNIMREQVLIAVADEITDLALEVAMLGESLSAPEDAVLTHAQVILMQKFDAITQALACYGDMLRRVHAQDGKWTSLHDIQNFLKPIPFYEVRQRLISKLLTGHQVSLALGHDAQDIWLEC